MPPKRRSTRKTAAVAAAKLNTTGVSKGNESDKDIFDDFEEFKPKRRPKVCAVRKKSASSSTPSPAQSNTICQSKRYAEIERAVLISDKTKKHVDKNKNMSYSPLSEKDNAVVQAVHDSVKIFDRFFFFFFE